MNPKRTQELESLLTKALSGVVIKSVNSSKRMRLSTYRKNLQSTRTKYDPSLRLQTSLFAPVVANPDLSEQILDLLQEELEEYVYDGKIHTVASVVRGGSREGSPLGDILTNLLRLTIIDGPIAAASAFDECTTSSNTIIKHFSVLTGLHIEEPLKVFDGVWLIPLSGQSARLPVYFPAFLGTLTGLEFMHTTILEVDYIMSPIFSKPSPEHHITNRRVSSLFTSTINGHEIENFDRHKFCQALALVCNSAVLTVLDWDYLDRDAVFNFGLSIEGGYRYSPRANLARDFDRNASVDVEKIREMYLALLALPERTQKALEIPIERWIESKAGRNLVDQMIGLGIAFESLFLAGTMEELSFRLRLRAAWYLGNSAADRQSLLEEFKNIYSTRSKAVHGGTLPSTLSIGGRRIRTRSFIARAQELCAASIRKAIAEGQLPDDSAWNDIVLGSDGG